jgi:ABC-2 type transport system permease protein
MRQTVRIFKKEFNDYFTSPIAYIVIAIFLLLTGWLFFSTFFIYGQVDLRDFFNRLPFLFAIVVPIITMRLFSEEFNVGSYELLLTLPVTHVDIVLGKFFAALAFIAAMLAPTLAYPAIITFLGDLDWGVVAGSYIGALLMGAAYAAIGLFASSLTRNQIIACIVAMVVCALLFIIDKMLFFFPQALLPAVAYLGAATHFENIAKGILDSRDIIYFLSIVFLGLYATRMVMQEKK